ncbi:zinc finger CCCH domain-containing protein 6-like [Quillaja saponaria]|uniref:Zinc finger CCCH domain-containing protein 6-like n=1 Tax=Quillaja saponaria TaxID=32244 RepID=A0AAD7LZ27_QUISA|nr:zinc finger CCCH domain-containing protein 6-like [Quillaja saponaria]
MRGLHKSKGVSWASDVDLCQVRLFLSEESPSQVGLGAQDHLQAKTSLLLQSTGAGSDDILPPGFEGAPASNQLQIQLSEIPLVKWTSPPRLVLNLSWQVVAGEESKEVDVQYQREMRVLEAIYPRPSAIPPNATVSLEAEDSDCNDEQIPLVPITPFEDEDAAADASFDSLAPSNITISSQPFLVAPGVASFSQCVVPLSERSAVSAEPAVVAAASEAFTAIMKSNEQGNLIDHELLHKILSNPKLIEKVVADYGSNINMQNIPNARSPPVPLSDPPPAYINRGEFSTLSSAGTSYPQPIGIGVGPIPSQRLPPPAAFPVPVSSAPPFGAPPAKDLNYYKSLIQQHGGEKQDTLPHFNNCLIQQPGASQNIGNNPKLREPKPKIMKPCIYFNSSRGCRHGVNCAYQHDATFQQRGSAVPEVQNSKRMKVDREISS